MIGGFLDIGLRPLDVTKTQEMRGDMVAGLILIPTRNSEWRDFAPESPWEGSCIPLIIYKSRRAAILVSYGYEKLWQTKLCPLIEPIIGMPVTARGD